MLGQSWYQKGEEPNTALHTHATFYFYWHRSFCEALPWFSLTLLIKHIIKYLVVGMRLNWMWYLPSGCFVFLKTVTGAFILSSFLLFDFVIIGSFFNGFSVFCWGSFFSLLISFCSWGSWCSGHRYSANCEMKNGNSYFFQLEKLITVQPTTQEYKNRNSFTVWATGI